MERRKAEDARSAKINLPSGRNQFDAKSIFDEAGNNSNEYLFGDIEDLPIKQ